MEQILNKKKPFTAGGKYKLPNGFLKALGSNFCQAIAVLTSTCWRLEYFPERFKNTKTVCLRKPGKRIYNQAKAWHPIALLNTTSVTVLAQLHIWHKSHTLPGSSICTVVCLLCYCLVAYLAQVTHLAGKFYLHCCLFALLLPDPLSIRTSPTPPASSLLFSFSSFLVFCLVHQSKSQVSSQVRSRLLDQLDLSSALLLPCHTTKDLPNYNTLHQAMFMSLSYLNNQGKVQSQQDS